MVKRSNTAHGERRGPAAGDDQSAAGQLRAARLLLNHGRSGEAESKLNALVKNARHDAPAPFLLGRIYANMAGACWFLRRPHEGIHHLERAIGYYKRTEHKGNAALGYNNLGINLTLVRCRARS